jgi:hypothetical protein
VNSVVLDPARKISIIIAARSSHHRLLPPTTSRKALIERSVESALAQENTTLSSEVIFSPDFASESIADHLKAIFPREVAEKRLRLRRPIASSDPGQLKNKGAETADGQFLTFLDMFDVWGRKRLSKLEPLLDRKDLVLGFTSDALRSSDWISTLLAGNPIISSSAVIRSQLFVQAGQFPEGYFGRIVSFKIPGADEYELWLKTMLFLAHHGKINRFSPEENPDLTHRRPEQPEELPLFRWTQRLDKKAERAREWISTGKLLRRIPKEYWPLVLKKLVKDPNIISFQKK